jgi:hypothetical protein
MWNEKDIVDESKGTQREEVELSTGEDVGRRGKREGDGVSGFTTGRYLYRKAGVTGYTRSGTS